MPVGMALGILYLRDVLKFIGVQIGGRQRRHAFFTVCTQVDGCASPLVNDCFKILHQAHPIHGEGDELPGGAAARRGCLIPELHRSSPKRNHLHSPLPG